MSDDEIRELVDDDGGEWAPVAYVTWCEVLWLGLVAGLVLLMVFG